MRLITIDLDDTLMACGEVDYGAAKQQFGEYISSRSDASVSEAIEVLNRIEKSNVDEHGLSMDRVPESFVEAYHALVDTPTPDGSRRVREMGESIFKTEEEYAERGLMDGAEQLLDTLHAEPFDLHLITAGDPRVQQRKIDGLQLDQYFDDTHIVPMDTKEETITELLQLTGYDSSHAYHIGNSLQSDVRAALEADANAIHVQTHQWREVENAEYYRTHDRVTMYDSLTHLVEDSPDRFHSHQLV